MGQLGSGESAKKETRGNLAEDLVFVASNPRDSGSVPSASRSKGRSKYHGRDGA
jgi:hypothetical protein